MSNPKSLTIASLVSIVGENKLYAYLNDIQYMYVRTFRVLKDSVDFYVSHPCESFRMANFQ